MPTPACASPAQAETMIISLTDRLIEQGRADDCRCRTTGAAGTEVVLRKSDGVVVARTGPVLAAAR